MDQAWTDTAREHRGKTGSLDALGKETHYIYDSAGRQETVAAGTLGDFDATEYFYSNTTGLLEKVRYQTSPDTCVETSELFR